MNSSEIIVLIGGLGAIAFTFWFFLMKKDDVVDVAESVTITVKGGYSPSVISIPKNKPTTITFLREDPSSCLEEVVLSDFKIKKFLPLNKKVDITLTPEKSGEYQFACGMNMFHGKIIVT